MTSLKHLLLLSVSTGLLLSGCSSIFGESEDAPLPGERVSVLELQKELEPNNTALSAQGFVTPKVWKNEFWPQRGGYPNHAMQNLDFANDGLEKTWSISIGAGSTKTTPLTTQPIIVGNTVFTMDSKLSVRAFNLTSGNQMWEASVKPPSEDEVAIGGGLAFGESLIFATNGFSEIAAIDPNSGQLVWRKTLPAAARSAPTVLNKKLFVQLSDNRLVALNTSNGEETWIYSGFQSESGLIGASSPAASQNLVVAAFSSGEITAINSDNGAVVWSDTLAPRRGAGGISSVADVTGLPVIDRDMVFAIGFGKRMLGLDAATGRRIWQKDIGGLETPWVVGNYIFVMTIDHKLIALGRETGSVSWISDLKPHLKDSGEFWTGPLLASGRLILASSGGQILEVSADDGTIIRTTKAEGNVTIPPVISNGRLYILSNNGKLTAYK